MDTDHARQPHNTKVSHGSVGMTGPQPHHCPPCLVSLVKATLGGAVIPATYSFIHLFLYSEESRSRAKTNEGKVHKSPLQRKKKKVWRGGPQITAST